MGTVRLQFTNSFNSASIYSQDLRAPLGLKSLTLVDHFVTFHHKSAIKACKINHQNKSVKFGVSDAIYLGFDFAFIIRVFALRT